MNEMEHLLKKHQEILSCKPSTKQLPVRNNTAEKSCSFEDFIQMLQKVMANVLPKCSLVPQEDVRNLMQPDVRLENPVIAFEVITRSPRRTQKPMLRNEVIERAYNNTEERTGMLYAWEMDYIIQFNIYAGSYESVQTTMNQFEEALLSYTGYFKKKGLVEILFEKQIKDNTLELFREHVSVRSLQYYVILEKYWIDFSSVLESVSISNQNEKGVNTCSK